MDDKGDEIIPSSVVSMVPSTAVDKSVAKEALDNCRTISNMLKAAHKYKEQAEKFIRLEAQTYVDCANLRGRLPKGTKTEDRRIIEWLETMSGQEQLGVIDKCAENSMSIRALYKRLQSASEAWKSEYKDFSHDERVDRKSIVNKGSSPRVRGADVHSVFLIRSYGIIPACAGSRSGFRPRP